MSQYRTEQENFWANDFGDQYTLRNAHQQLLISNTALFVKVLARIGSIESILELGANIGNNLKVLHTLLPETELSAVEINPKAIDALHALSYVKTYHASILDFTLDYPCDFVFVKGVLIHIAPEYLSRIYDLLYTSSRRYIALMEYYNPTPVEVKYRGHDNKLFKRDFAGELLDRYAGRLRLVDYGFFYHRDTHFPADDMTWFLMEKTNCNSDST